MTCASMRSCGLGLEAIRASSVDRNRVRRVVGATDQRLAHRERDSSGSSRQRTRRCTSCINSRASFKAAWLRRARLIGMMSLDLFEVVGAQRAAGRHRSTDGVRSPTEGASSIETV